jgi:hypothetical protein
LIVGIGSGNLVGTNVKLAITCAQAVSANYSLSAELWGGS